MICIRSLTDAEPLCYECGGDQLCKSINSDFRCLTATDGLGDECRCPSDSVLKNGNCEKECKNGFDYYADIDRCDCRQPKIIDSQTGHCVFLCASQGNLQKRFSRI